jgi:hypothetical protein
MRGNTGPGAPVLVCLCLGEIGNHHAAFLGATAAGFGALPAMFQRMLRAFLCADFAHLSTKLQNHIDHFAVPGHVGACQAANLCAVHIQPDAPCHFSYVGFRQTGDSAMITGIRAIGTRLDAGLVFMDHRALLLSRQPFFKWDDDREFKFGGIFLHIGVAWKIAH